MIYFSIINLKQYEMTNDDLNMYANSIWSRLNSILGEKMNKESQIEMIKTDLMKLGSEQRKVGRNQILNYLEDEIKGLRK